MFDRSSKGRLDDLDIVDDLHRFNNDEYATKYLVRCYNPEWKVRVARPKDKPRLSLFGAGINVSKRIFSTHKEVL